MKKNRFGLTLIASVAMFNIFVANECSKSNSSAEEEKKNIEKASLLLEGEINNDNTNDGAIKKAKKGKKYLDEHFDKVKEEAKKDNSSLSYPAKLAKAAKYLASNQPD